MSCWLRGALAAACLVALGCRGAPPPDVVLITLDTTRADHLGAYGYPRPVSPALDALSRESVLFERAWTTAPWTLPAHASMFTGKHPTSHGAHFDREHGDASLDQALEDPNLESFRVSRLGEAEQTLAELLRERGYATAAFAGGPWLAPAFGLLQGYDVRDAEVNELGGRSAAELTDAAIAWLRGVPRDRPLHLLVNYFDPHAPYEPPDEIRAEVARVPRPSRPAAEVDARIGRHIEEAIDRYDGEIRYMDHHAGRLLDALRDSGRYEDALILVVADHGELFGEHDSFHHGRYHYEELLRVPLLVRLPGARDGGLRDERPVSVVDLLPLVAREVDLPLPAGVEGVLPGQRRLVLAELFPDEVSIRNFGAAFDRYLVTGIRWPWKLIQSEPGGAMLFRLDEDPHERHDLGPSRADPDLHAALEEARAALAPPARRSAPSDVSPTTLESLRELGYVE